MENKGTNKNDQELRKKAEKELQEKTGRSHPYSEADSLKLIHELEVHQIELEMLNEELTEAKHAAEEASKKYSDLYDFAPSGYLTLTREGKIVELNLQAATMLRKERSLISGHPFSFFVNITSKKSFDDFIEKIFKNKSKITSELELVDKKDNVIHALLTGIPADENSCHVIMTDISSRKEAERQLEITETRYRRLFETAKDGILILDALTGKITDINPYLVNKLGYKREHFLNKAIWEISLFRDFIRNREKFSELQQRDVRYNDVLLERADGKQINVEIVANAYREGSREVIQCNIRDITERKKIEEALRETEQRWVTTLASIGDAVVATDPEERILFINREAERLTGWDYKDVLNKDINEVIKIIKKPDESGRLNENEELFHHFDHSVLLNKSGKEIPVEYKSSPILTFEGKIKGNVLILKDTTQRERADEMIKNYSSELEETVKKRTAQLEIARQRAESADRLKTAFLLNMSHELRTPLNSIIGFSGILLKQLAGPLNPEQQKQLEMVQKSGRHLLSLITDILDISKIDAGELKADLEIFNFQDVIEEMKTLLQPFADAKGVELKFVKDSSIGKIKSDKKRVSQILINLINNALKFTEKGSVTINCYRDQEYVLVEVADTGIGIRQEDIEKLFNPFIQLENNLIRNYEGSGLGLSISGKLLEMLHGSVSVKSEFGIGSTFSIRLPLE